MKKVIILQGLPASGKTTWAKNEQDAYPGRYKRINKDELRRMLDNGNWSKANDKFILNLRDEMILDALGTGCHVIVDDTNLHPRHEARIRQITKGLAEVEIKDFTDVDIELCIERDLQRCHSVGEKVIKKMYNQFLKPPPVKYKPIGTCRAIIVDLDGTLADHGKRSPFDWGKVREDTPHTEIVQLVNMYYGKGYAVFIVSGRDGCCKEDTIEWLNENNIYYTKLFMREPGSTEKDAIIKERVFRKEIEPEYDVKFVLDDRNCVVSMWRSIGLKCLQVAEGDF